jgi:hypothetical protein
MVLRPHRNLLLICDDTRPAASGRRCAHRPCAISHGGPVEPLEAALRDPCTAAAAAEALSTPIDAILVHPGGRRGEVSPELRSDLAAFCSWRTQRPARMQERPLRGLGTAVLGE